MPTRYEDDVYAWSQETARAIAEGRWDEVDLAHVADEISDVGKTEQRALQSQMERILVHLLKIRFQPGRHTRSWDISIADARDRIEAILSENPSLRPTVPAKLGAVYKLARNSAALQTGLPLESFPEACPFSADEVFPG